MGAIDDSLREIRYKERDGYPYIIHPLMDGVPRVTPDLLRDWCQWATQQPMLENATLLLAPEAMGIHLAVPICLETDIPYVVARKREYGLDGEIVAYCETGYGQSCIYLNDIGPDDRVVIVDDVISTGGTLKALIETLGQTGAKLEGVLVAISKGDGAKDLRDAGVNLVAMRTITMDDGQFTVS